MEVQANTEITSSTSTTPAVLNRGELLRRKISEAGPKAIEAYSAANWQQVNAVAIHFGGFALGVATGLLPLCASGFAANIANQKAQKVVCQNNIDAKKELTELFKQLVQVEGKQMNGASLNLWDQFGSYTDQFEGCDTAKQQSTQRANAKRALDRIGNPLEGLLQTVGIH